MITITCPKCNADSKLSLVQSVYQGPHRCWKCRALYTIELANNELKSCVPLDEKEFEKQQEIEALKAKFKQH